MHWPSLLGVKAWVDRARAAGGLVLCRLGHHDPVWVFDGAQLLEALLVALREERDRVADVRVVCRCRRCGRWRR